MSKTTGPAKPTADAIEIRRALDLLTVPGGVVEIRGIDVPAKYGKPIIVAGYFNDLDKAAKAAAALDAREPAGVYIILNEITPRVLAWSPNLLTERPKHTTGDGHIKRRRWLPLDFDPVRPAGLSSTDAEHDAAREVAERCRDYLREDAGWPDPILADSGNGWHLLYSIDLPPDDGGLVENCLKVIAAEIDTPAIKTDLSVFNPSRIFKLYGTVARKAYPMPDEPHRVARLVEIPSTIQVVTKAKLEALAATVKQPEPSRASTVGNGQGQPFTSRLDVPKWLTARGVSFKVKDRPDQHGWTVYLLEQCPFDSSHGKGNEVAVYQGPDGELAAGCMHNSCTGKGWQDFKAAIGKPDPDQYDPPLSDHRLNGQADSRGDRTNQAAGDDKTKDRFPLVSCAALDQADYTPRPIITDCLYAGHPAIDGGMYKTLKTLVAIDGAVSIATGRPFMGTFTVPEPMAVVYFSGEGGGAMVQEYARRVAYAKGFKRLADVPNLDWCFTIPKLESLHDLDDVKRKHDETGAGLMVFDNLMLALSGDEPGNVFKMGQILGNVVRICNERSITPQFIHHFKRTRATADPYAPGELLDLTQAGAAEIAGQWWLLTRRERYDPDQPGEHKLWLNIGGRLGHGCLHALDVHEGRLSDPGGRRWELDIKPATEARQDADARQEEAKRQRAEERAAATLDSDRKELVKILAKAKRPQTKTEIRSRAGFGYDRFNRAFASLAEDATIRPVEVTKGKGQHPYEGWRLKADKET